MTQRLGTSLSAGALALTSWLSCALALPACGGTHAGVDGGASDAAMDAYAPPADGGAPDMSADAAASDLSLDGAAQDLALHDASLDLDVVDAEQDGGVEPPHNYVFVTGARFAPTTIASAQNADALCNAAAAAGDPRLAGRTYIAWVSDSTTDARDRLGDASGWQRLDGLPFVLSRDTLLGSSAHLYYPPRLDENGVDVVLTDTAMDTQAQATYFATGTGPSGTVGNNCNDWTSGVSSYTGGLADATGSSWSSTLGGACSIEARLLCLGVDFATPIRAPRPPTGSERAVFAASGVGLTGPTGVAALDALCQSQASTAGFTGTYRALVAVPGASALSRFTAEGGPWLRTDGAVAVSDPSTFLTNGVPDTALATFRADGTPVFTSVATGAATLLTPGSDATTCAGYTSDAGSDTYAGAHSWRTHPRLLGALQVPCSSLTSVICMAR
ncbi:MAG: hypothetical protein KC593_09665 [Myxococcales bacterium]|nr:hypothetical protein [Myxococcales bacterium]